MIDQETFLSVEGWIGVLQRHANALNETYERSKAIGMRTGYELLFVDETERRLDLIIEAAMNIKELIKDV